MTHWPGPQDIASRVGPAGVGVTAGGPGGYFLGLLGDQLALDEGVALVAGPAAADGVVPGHLALGVVAAGVGGDTGVFALHAGNRPSQVTNSIMLCWLFTIKDRGENVIPTFNTQSRFASAVFDKVLRPLRLAGTPTSVLVALKFQKQRQRQG